jgi:hypothetical protein
VSFNFWDSLNSSNFTRQAVYPTIVFLAVRSHKFALHLPSVAATWTSESTEVSVSHDIELVDIRPRAPEQVSSLAVAMYAGGAVFLKP